MRKFPEIFVVFCYSDNSLSERPSTGCLRQTHRWGTHKVCCDFIPLAPPANTTKLLARDAKEALRKARSFFEDKDPDDEEGGPPSPPPELLCAECKAPVAQPCWYWVHCDDPSFVCDACDAKDKVSFGTHDTQTHDLVRVQELVDDVPLTMEERLGELEARFVKHEVAMDG